MHTTEHVLGRLVRFNGIDNARLLELNGPEVPILDGSAMPFHGGQIVRKPAVQGTRSRLERFFKVQKETSAYRGDDGVRNVDCSLSTTDEFKVTVMVDYNSPVLGTQHARLGRPLGCVHKESIALLSNVCLLEGSGFPC